MLEQWWNPVRRREPIGQALARLSFALRQGHEADTLAIEHLVSKILEHEVPLDFLVEDTVLVGNLLIRHEEALSLVTAATLDPVNVRLADELYLALSETLHYGFVPSRDGTTTQLST